MRQDGPASAAPPAGGVAVWTRQALHELIEGRLKGHKFIVVANREPYVHRYAGDEVQCIQPASGMATAVDPIMIATGGTWVAHGSGDADRATVDEHDRIRVPPEEPAYSLRRVWLTKDQEDGYYYGLANEGLWPLCHITFTRPVFHPKDWETYKQVNELFARAVLEEANDQPALVFIQDYHFCLLPAMLKQMAGGKLLIAHFWHIPWPNREILRAFPWQEELLDGLLGNDLLGFHIRYHCQNFLDTVERGIEAKVDLERFEVTRGGKVTTVRPFPISIDFAQHEAEAKAPAVDQAMRRWRKRLRLRDLTLGVGIERLDYTKGIPERLRGLNLFFERHPEWRRKVVFVQIAVPSRSHLPQYRRVEDDVDALADEINWHWGGDGWKPVVLLKEHQGPEEMMALHRLARFLVVSSLHDGMNLVAKEFIASRSDEEGVLILSKFTGAHRELPESLGVNPFAEHELADAIHKAVTMPAEEQRRRMRRMREQVATNNVYRWAGKILSTLLKLDFPDSESWS
jgi:trehalose 6-phosphate synthase